MALADVTRRTGTMPWWAFPVALWVVSRAISTAYLGAFASRQEANSWTPASPGLFDYSTMWDAHWYYIVSQLGYPSELPLDGEGHIAENAWAFMPVFPFVARAIMLLGLPWEIASVALAAAAGLGFALVAFRLFERIAPGRERFALAVVLLSPLSPMLQIGYPESLFLLLLAACLLAWVERAWPWLWVLVPVMALTRPSGLAFAFALGLWFVHRWLRRDREPWPVAERWHLVALGAWSTLWGFAWLIISGVATRRWDAYIETELAWRSVYIGRGELVPFTPWPIGLEWWFHAWWPLVLVLILAAAVALLAGPWARRVRIEARWWVIAFLVYLAAVWFPQSSTWRILMPIFPAAAIVAGIRPAWIRAGILVLCVALQPVWLWFCWHVVSPDWTVP